MDNYPIQVPKDFRPHNYQLPIGEYPRLWSIHNGIKSVQFDLVKKVITYKMKIFKIYQFFQAWAASGQMG